MPDVHLWPDAYGFDAAKTFDLDLLQYSRSRALPAAEMNSTLLDKPAKGGMLAVRQLVP